MIAFECVADRTCEGQVVGMGYSPITLWDDVFDIEPVVKNEFRNLAVFATVVGTARDKQIVAIHVGVVSVRALRRSPVPRI